MTTFKNNKVLFIPQYEKNDFYNTDYRFESLIIDPIYNDFISNRIKKDNSINIDYKTELPENPIFYFGETSKFPRFKLKTNNYKRCNIYKKSNVQVINKIECYNNIECCVFEKDNTYYILPRLSLCSLYRKSNFVAGNNNYWTWKEIHFSSVKDKIQYIKKTYEFNDPVYIGTLFTTYKNTWEDLLKVIENKFTYIITDNTLDDIINNKMDNITEEDIDLLQDLLRSRDDASLELGLKMLTGYNCSKYPCTIKLLLSNPRLKDTKAWTSTGLRQVKSTIGFSALGWPAQMVNYYIFNQENFNQDDLKLAHYIWKKWILPVINRDINCYNIPGLTFKVYAEENDNCDSGL